MLPFICYYGHSAQCPTMFHAAAGEPRGVGRLPSLNHMQPTMRNIALPGDGVTKFTQVLLRYKSCGNNLFHCFRFVLLYASCPLHLKGKELLKFKVCLCFQTLFKVTSWPSQTNPKIYRSA